MPKKSEDLVMGTVLGVRLTNEESARLDALVARVHIATKHRIARAALLRGLADFEADPMILLEDPATPVRPKARAHKAPRRRAT